MSALFGVICGLITMSLWAVANTFEARAARHISPFRVMLWSQSAGLVALCLAALFLDTQTLAPSALLLGSVVGLLTIPALWSLYASMRVGKLAVVIPIASSYPAVTVLLATTVFGERLTALQQVGVICCVLGAALLTTDWQQLRAARKHGWLPGVGFAALTALLWGVQNTLLKPLTATDWFTPFLVVQFATVFGAWLLIPLVRETHAFPKQQGTVVTITGILATAAFVILGLGIHTSLASIVVPVAAAFPLPVVLLGAIVLKERPTRTQFALSALTVLGIIFLAL